MLHELTPNDLQTNEAYELIDEVSYINFKPFILKALRKKSLLISIFSIVQIFALVGAIVTLSILLFHYFGKGNESESLKWFLISMVVSFTVLIPIHEIIHALAFILLGKKDIGFGVQLKKFIFYAEANKQVLNRFEINIVAFAPLVIIEIISIIFGLIFLNSSMFFFWLGLFLIHFTFCAGDIALVSYFSQKGNIYCFDDRTQRTTFFYKEKEST